MYRGSAIAYDLIWSNVPRNSGSIRFPLKVSIWWVDDRVLDSVLLEVIVAIWIRYGCTSSGSFDTFNLSFTSFLFTLFRVDTVIAFLIHFILILISLELLHSLPLVEGSCRTFIPLSGGITINWKLWIKRPTLMRLVIVVRANQHCRRLG